MAYKKQKTKLLFLILLQAVFLAFGQSAQAGSITKDSVITLVNEARAKASLSVLSENSHLSQAAKSKAEDMIKKDYFAHNSVDGKTPWYWIEKAGYDYKYAGENLAVNFTSAETQQEAWMKSETHRKNILNKNYQEIGVAVTKGKIGGEETTLVVQMFGAPFVAAVSQNKKPVPAKEEIKIASEKEAAVLPAEVFKTEETSAAREKKNNLSPVNQEISRSGKNGMAKYPWLVTFAIISLSFVCAPFLLVAKGYQLLATLSKIQKEIKIQVKERAQKYEEIISEIGEPIVQNDGSLKIKIKSG
jgi:uncharacterized protein YkwD